MLTKGSAPDELVRINHVLSYEKGDMTKEVMATLDNELWKEVGFDNFAGLIYSPLPNGFESTREVFRHWFRNSTGLLNRINEALPDKDIKPYETDLQTSKSLQGHGGTKGNKNASKSEDRNEVDNINSVSGGTSAEYTARRLKRDNPELLDKVKEGDLSLNQAAVQAGFRKKNISIPFDPQEAARALKRRYAKTEWDLLINEIQILTNQEKP